MRIKSSYSNARINRTVHAHITLPTELQELNKLAHNIWWVWCEDALDMFEAINPELWEEVEQNPVLLLKRLTKTQMQEIIDNKDLMIKINAVCQKFKDYMAQPYDKNKTSVAYFSMEYGFTKTLKIYSGGLGVLAGDYLKEASDSHVDLTGVGLLYRNGYFAQSIAPDGQQVANRDTQIFDDLPLEQMLEEDGTPMVLAVPYPDRNVYANVWRVNVGRIPLYLLDTDLESNSEFDRPITGELYGGDWENRIKQEILLGIGGIHLLNKLGIKKNIYHCNEGHAAFINVQRILDLIEKDGLTFNQALEVVRSSGLYTVHTPVPAGHDYFDEGLLYKYFASYPDRLGISWQDFIDMGRENPGSNERFSMSIFALNTCQEANGVSYLHGIVSQKMFQPLWPSFFPEELHVSYVTNGVHLPTWTSKEMKALYEKHFSKDFYDNQSDEKIWDAIQKVKDEEIWEVRKTLKEKLLKYIQRHIEKGMTRYQASPTNALTSASAINPNALLVGFGRRFATYKRAHLLFSDLDRLAKLVNNEDKPIQFIYTGKAHPADGAGQGLIKHIIEISKRPEFSGKILFLENYDMNLAKHLIPGVDVWLNTPTRPLEASGTSGQKAVMNGVLNFSVLDGWWYEGYQEEAGWMLTDKRTYENQAYQDELDALKIYYTFEQDILPLYYDRGDKDYSSGWIQYIKNSINHVAPQFTMKRMIDDYIERFYKKLEARHALMIANNYAKAKEIAAWKEDTASKWDNIEVVYASFYDEKSPLYGNQTYLIDDQHEVAEVIIDKKDIQGDLGLDCVVSRLNPITNEMEFVETIEFEEVKQEGSKIYFEHQPRIDTSGTFNLAFRIYPKSKDLPHKMDFAYVKWF